jgi:magnesium-transporting ATPase (P-type)
MLTGDKMETAENIAKSCKLIQPGFEILRFKIQDKLPQDTGIKASKEKDQGAIKDIVLAELKKLV